MYKNLSNQILCTKGIARFEIELGNLPGRKLLVEANVINNEQCEIDLILGRDVLLSERIKLIYNPSVVEKEDKATWIEHAFFFIDVFQQADTVSDLADRLQTDFDEETDRQLRDLLHEIENAELPLKEDDYSVKVHLKDESTYAYAPAVCVIGARKSERNYL